MYYFFKTCIYLLFIYIILTKYFFLSAITNLSIFVTKLNPNRTVYTHNSSVETKFKHHDQPICKSTKILFKYKKYFDIVQSVSFTNIFETKFEKNSLFPARKSYIFSKSLQPPLQNLAHQNLSSSKSDSAVNKVVQQIGAASPFSFGAFC